MAALSASLVRRLLDALLGATALWSRGEAYDEALVSSVRAALVLERHRRYVEGIPVYRRLAAEQGTASGADVAAIIDAMMVSTDIFKSYEPETLESGDFDAMTDWLAEVSTCRPPAPPGGVRDVGGWRGHPRRPGGAGSPSRGPSRPAP